MRTLNLTKLNIGTVFSTLRSFRIEQITSFLIREAHTFFTTSFLHDKIRIFLYSPIFLAIGISIYFGLPFEPPISIVISIWLLTGSILIQSLKNRTLTKLILPFFIIVSGTTICQIKVQFLHTPIIDRDIPYILLYGDIASIEKLGKEQGSRITLKNLQLENIKQENTPRKIRLKLRHDEDIQTGQRIKALASLSAPSDPLIPNGFDFRRHLYLKGYGSVGFIYKKPEIIKNAPEHFLKIQPLRDHIAKIILNTLPAEQSSIALALITGQKNAIREEDRQAIRDAGLAHMLAISGLHIGLVASTVFFCVRIILAAIEPIALRLPIKKIAAVMAFAGAVFYMLLAGTTIPTQRAVIMISIVFLAIILDRSPISMRVLTFSALIILITTPESLISASFQMSFSAVLSLVFFYEKTKNIWSYLYNSRDGILYKLSLYFLSVLITTLIASIATAPFSLYHFGQVSFLGSAANLIAVPLLAFIIMPFALLSLIFMPIGLEYYPLSVMGQGISHILEIAHWFSSLPHAIIRTPQWSFIGFITLITAAVTLVTAKNRFKPIVFILSFITLQRILISHQPDILIHADHKLMLFRTAQNRAYVNDKRNSRFVREEWAKNLGMLDNSISSLSYKGDNANNTDHQFCQEEGCRFIIKEQKISFVRHPYILDEECQWADILISKSPIRIKCKSPIIIDKFDSWEWGSHAIFIQNGTTYIKTVRHKNLNRPWSVVRNNG